MLSQCVAFFSFTPFIVHQIFYFYFDYLCSAAADNCSQYKIQQHIRSIFICDQRLFVWLLFHESRCMETVFILIIQLRVYACHLSRMHPTHLSFCLFWGLIAFGVTILNLAGTEIDLCKHSLVVFRSIIC